MIIAEAGVNHNGDLNLAKRLVDMACDAKADAVKFQFYHTEQLAVSTLQKTKYQKRNTGCDDSQFDMLKKLELSAKDMEELFWYCKSKNIQFLSSAFEEESYEYLDQLGVQILKIPSGEITNYLLLKRLSYLKQDIILSTGMASFDEIKDAIELLESNHIQRQIILLHCISSYPTKLSDVNLRVMESLRTTFLKQVGFSDHTIGYEAGLAAVAMGATVIEKHITLNKEWNGPDHRVSMEPNEFKNYVNSIRRVEQALGNGAKTLTEEEQQNKKLVRKYLVATRPIKKGDTFTLENIGVKRVGEGITPMRINEILGRKAQINYEKDERIKE